MQYGEAPSQYKYKTPPGSRGYVRISWNSEHGYCAVKKFNENCFADGLAELNVLKKVSDLMPTETRPLIDYAISKNSKGESQVYLFMRWIPGTDGVDFAMELFRDQDSDQHIGHTIVQIAQQLFADVAEMHEKGMAHRDIKLENLMVYKDKFGNAKVELIDFGDTLTNFNDPVMRHMLCGTSGYIPPEALCGNVPDPKVQDVWASLMSLVILLTTRISPKLSNDFHEDLADQERKFIENRKTINVVGTVQQHLENLNSMYAQRMGDEFKNSEMHWCIQQLQECFKEYANASVNRLVQRFNQVPLVVEKLDLNRLHPSLAHNNKMYA